jgi:hypothetical protein
MKTLINSLLVTFVFLFSGNVFGQTEEKNIVDVVWLKDGSKLSGTILKWELTRGMEFKLITGAEIILTKADIARVFQDIPFSAQDETDWRARVRGPRPYNFKEEGMYHTFSGFLNFSVSGGAGLHYSIGHRFNRLLGVGIGTGIETHDFNNNRDILPVYAEARGFLLEKKITPYYAFKIGYGFALKDEQNFTTEAKGGIHFSPEVGVRFGADDVNCYVGLEYKLQNATFVTEGFNWDGQGRFTDKVSYRRVELRTGLLF